MSKNAQVVQAKTIDLHRAVILPAVTAVWLLSALVIAVSA